MLEAGFSSAWIDIVAPKRPALFANVKGTLERLRASGIDDPVKVSNDIRKCLGSAALQSIPRLKGRARADLTIGPSLSQAGPTCSASTAVPLR